MKIWEKKYKIPKPKLWAWIHSVIFRLMKILASQNRFQSQYVELFNINKFIE